MTSPWSYAPDATTGTNGSNIPNGDLYAGDYVEYRLYVGSGVPAGQGTNGKVRTDLTYDSAAVSPWTRCPWNMWMLASRWAWASASSAGK